MLKGGTGLHKTNQPHLPLVSIITVVYNGSKYIEQTINSVLNQSYKNIEYIIIDGGSTDDTLNIIKRYESKIDYWQSEPDEGIFFAMNKGISLAKGELIGIINADDFYLPGTVKNVVEADNVYHADIYHGDMQYISEKGEPLSSAKPDIT